MAATETNPNIPAGAGNLTDRLRFALTRLSNQQRILLLIAIAAVIALVVASNTWIKQADYRILFSNISERDGGAVIAALDQMNVPYRFSDSGSAILVPSSRVHDVRLRLATQGLPKGGGVGFELMENQKFGISQFAEQVNYQRGLEGELARTIQSIGRGSGCARSPGHPQANGFCARGIEALGVGAAQSVYRTRARSFTNCRHPEPGFGQCPESLCIQCHPHRPERDDAFATEERADGGWP